MSNATARIPTLCRHKGTGQAVVRLNGRDFYLGSYKSAAAQTDSYRDIDPRSAWGMSQGLTALAREEVFTDKRSAMERSAGRILQMAF